MSRRRRNETVVGVDEGLDAEVAEDPLIDEAQFPRGALTDAPVRVLAGALSLHTPRPVPRRGSCSFAPRPIAGRLEAEDGTSMPVDRVIDAVDAQLTAHPQMDEQAELRPLPEAEPHELPSPFGTDDPVAGDCGDEPVDRSEEHTSELQSRFDLVGRLL